MPFVLGPNALAAGYRLFSYDTIGSTSTEALALARAGDRGRVWLASLEQTAGYGRRGRQWQTPRGNLATSVFLRTTASISRSATLGLVAGLALHDALSELAPDLAIRMALDHGETRATNTRLALKWPNDLVADGGKKLAGIGLQAVDLGAGEVGVVAGIGVNVVAAPEGVPFPTTSLHGLRNRVTAEELFAELAEAWVVHERRWDNGNGLDAVRRLWLERASGLGEEVAVRTDAGVTRGIFETIDEEGCLVVRVGDGTARRITAGDVHFGAAASLRAAG